MCKWSHRHVCVWREAQLLVGRGASAVPSVRLQPAGRHVAALRLRRPLHLPAGLRGAQLRRGAAREEGDTAARPAGAHRALDLYQGPRGLPPRSVPPRGGKGNCTGHECVPWRGVAWCGSLGIWRAPPVCFSEKTGVALVRSTTNMVA